MAACSGDFFSGGGSVVTNTDPVVAGNSSDEHSSSSTLDSIDNDGDNSSEILDRTESSTIAEESSEDRNTLESSEDGTLPPQSDTSENSDESSEESMSSTDWSEESSAETTSEMSSESESSPSTGISSQDASYPQHSSIDRSVNYIEAESYYPSILNSDVSLITIDDIFDKKNNKGIDELENSQLVYYLTLEELGEYEITVRAFGESNATDEAYTLKIECIDESTSQILDSKTYEIPSSNIWSFTTNIFDLPQGDLIMKVTPESNNYQINYFEISFIP